MVNTSLLIYIDYDLILDGEAYPACFARDIDLGMNDQIFGFLGGITTSPALYAPRGMPEKVSAAIMQRYTLAVNDDLADQGLENFCTQHEAKQWIAQGQSRWFNPIQSIITVPGSYSASWLKASELSNVRRRFVEYTSPHHILAVRLDALIAMMKVLDRGNDGRSRVVYWFEADLVGPEDGY